MKRFTLLLAIPLLAILTFSITGCDDDDVVYKYIEKQEKNTGGYSLPDVIFVESADLLPCRGEEWPETAMCYSEEDGVFYSISRDRISDCTFGRAILDYLNEKYPLDPEKN